METYKGTINEYVDWVTGIDSITGNKLSGVSDETPISGQSIRELVQSHLKTPFVTYRDDKGGYIRFFSSKEALNLWMTYSDNTNPLYDLEKASDLVLYNMDLPATYKIVGLDSFVSTRYIILGNSNSSNALLDYTIGIKDALEESLSDVVRVTYTITDNAKNINFKETDSVETGKRISRNIYKYLKPGENKINVEAIANNYPAKTTKEFSIYLVNFSISSNFTGYYTGVSSNIFQFLVKVDRSITNLKVLTTITIDGRVASRNDYNHSEAIYEETSTQGSFYLDINLYNIYNSSTEQNSQKHVMTIISRMEDVETLVSFESNILYYEFEVRPLNDELTYQFVNLAYSVANSNYSTQEVNNILLPVINVSQFMPTTIGWGYYTDSFTLNLQTDVKWTIRKGYEGLYIYTELANIRGIKDTKPTLLTFIPPEELSYELNNSFLVARINNVDIAAYPLNIQKSDIKVSETTPYSLKLSAYGKTNESDLKNQWIDAENNVYTVFSPRVKFDNNTGWNNNSLVLKGVGATATIQYCPFPKKINENNYKLSDLGATFEIDFKPEYINNENDILLSIGDVTKAHIEIRPTKAAYYEGGSLIILTNYKSGERIKLAFIFNPDSSKDSGLIFIVNNGILERVAQKGSAAVTDDEGRIIIGGTNSSIRVYMIRAYRNAIPVSSELSNYMFDNSDNINLISRNDIYGSNSEITYTGLLGKLDIITIEGDLTNILSNGSDKENATVNMSRISNTDSTKDFTLLNCRIRNHGQSTLSYAITSMKVWFNQSKKQIELTGPDGTTSLIEVTPTLSCKEQEYLGLNKNRYVMKSGAIPSNKFVLQANYADSSGSHNGSLLRLINNTWYNTIINNLFRLRTDPLLFASGFRLIHNDSRIGEDSTWIEGVYNLEAPNLDTASDLEIANYLLRRNKTWTEISGIQFPYIIRNSADSFPCSVFYKDTSQGLNDLTFLGQYVFMDDKKSDYIYGERSIYYTEDPSDPFCLKIKNKKLDSKGNKVWSNKNVLHIEVVYPNSPLTSYYSKQIASAYDLDPETDTLTPADGAVTKNYYDPVEVDLNGNTTMYLWEQHFELIYPDKDDIKNDSDEFDAVKFNETVQPFMDFLGWITDVGALKSEGNKLGNSGALAWVSYDELDKFIREAHNHLDLYKLAAYYIFFSRFGLVDSVERNAQLKTYDGLHWHYEPWDMDIALGCANNGVIAYDPPITRDSRSGGSSYVFAGRSSIQSNVLWDCLECWDVWMNEIVPEVAQALYEAGLTYENASKMFDDEYVNKWCESVYNESGHYKYIEAPNANNLYLNGARTSHRHWWLSKSMNYYDAKWNCGDFTKHTIEVRINKEASASGSNLIKLYPTNNTFFRAQYGSQGSPSGVTPLGDGLTEALVETGASIDASIKMDDKAPCIIFGASSIEGLDLSTFNINTLGVIGKGYIDIKFEGAYDNVLGAPLKWIKLGAPCTPSLYDYPDATSYTSNLSIGPNTIIGISGDNDALENVELVDVVGMYLLNASEGGSIKTTFLSEIFREKGHDRVNIKKFYAMGCNSANEFATSQAGNNFDDLRLPTSVRTLTLTNSSWENISFWQTTLLPNQLGRYDKVPVPASIDTIQLLGTTGKNACSWDLIKTWILSIEDSLPVDHTELDLLNALKNKTLIADQLNWDDDAGITYTDIIRLGHFGNGGYTYPLKGYVVMSETEEPLTSTQLLSLTELFGANVFNIGTVNSNLVIDHKRKSVRISISAKAGLTIQNDSIYVLEPLIGSNAARLVANHFTLTASTAENLIVNNISDLDRLTDNNYLWTFVDDPTSIGGASGSTYKYASLRLGADGQVRLEVDESDGVAYNINVRVYYKDGAQRVQDTLTLTTIPVTFPDHYEFYTYGDTVRKFKYTSDIAASLFGLGFALLNPLPPVYIIGKSNHKSEFALRPYPAKLTTSVGPGGATLYVTNWTATEKSVEYLLYSYTNNADRTEVMTKEELGSGDSTTHNLGLDITVKYSKDAVYGGINIVVDGIVSNDPQLYCIQSRIKIGGKETLINNLYFMVVNDNEVIVPANGSPLAVTLYNKYIELYYSGLSTVPGTFPMYKMHLLSLYGELDFSLLSTIGSIMTSRGDTVLKYIPNITSLVFDGCSLLYKVDPLTSLDSFDLSNLSKLTSISLNGCSGAVGVLDFSNNVLLERIDVRNTSLGIILPLRSNVTTLLLGSPISIDIRSPKYLSTSGVSIQSKVNLNSINLENINVGDLTVPALLCGFNIFNTLYT